MEDKCFAAYLHRKCLDQGFSTDTLCNRNWQFIIQNIHKRAAPVKFWKLLTSYKKMHHTKNKLRTTAPAIITQIKPNEHKSTQTSILHTNYTSFTNKGENFTKLYYIPKILNTLRLLTRSCQCSNLPNPSKPITRRRLMLNQHVYYHK